MEIKGYKNKDTQKLCCDSRYAKKQLGELIAEKLSAVMNFLENAETLDDAACIPGYHLHQLLGERKDQFAIDLGRKLGFRLIITPDPPLGHQENELDFHSKCRFVKSIFVLEVSNHYE